MRLVALLAAAFVARPREAAGFAIFLALGFATLLALSVYFTVAYDTYVPRRTGFGRVFQLTIAVVLLGLAVLPGLIRRTAAPMVTVALVVLGALLLSASRQPIAALGLEQPPRDLLAAERSLALSDRDVVLANAYTEGFIPLVFGARGLLDGQAPYTDRDLLAHVNSVLGEARAFFENPMANRGLLKKYGVTHVLVVPRGRALGPQRVFNVNTHELGTAPFLESVASAPGLILYRVLPAQL
jgi:hypothetical protein